MLENRITLLFPLVNLLRRDSRSLSLASRGLAKTTSGSLEGIKPPKRYLSRDRISLKPLKALEASSKLLGLKSLNLRFNSLANLLRGL